LEEALRNDISIETSSAYDMDIVKSLYKEGKVTKDIEVICNGFKTDDYLAKISDMINSGFENITRFWIITVSWINLQKALIPLSISESELLLRKNRSSNFIPQD
jgi:hypothetical protein